MTRDLKAAFPTTEMRARDRRWSSPIGDQAAEVVDAMRAEPELYWIYVGHSMGGLVARDVRHRMLAEYQAGQRATLPYGVITIGTPHLGAPIAARVPELVYTARTLLTTVNGVACGVLYGYSTSTDALCLGSARMGEFVESNYLAGLIPAASRVDMIPRSAYLTARNAQKDFFVRAAIRSHSPPRWAAARAAGDAIETCPPEADFCNGDAIVALVETGYQSLRGLAYFFATNGLYFLAERAQSATNALDSYDTQWSIITTQGDPTEPPRVSRRLPPVRGWRHDETTARAVPG